MKRASSIMCATLFGAQLGQAQCNISMSVSQWFTCTGQGSLSTLQISAVWSGGTPPFTVQIPGQPTQFVSSSNALFLISYPSAPNVVPPITVTVTDAMLCQASSSYAFTSGVMSIQDGTRIQMTTTDCGAGLFSVSLVDNPNVLYDALAGDLAGDTYTLYKNGQQVGSGLLTSVFFPLPSRLVFPGLTAGQFQLVMNHSPGDPSQAICPSMSQISFTVPNAGDCGVNFRLWAGLDGALPSGSIMTDGLRAANLIPTSEPYSALGYAYVGSSNGISIYPALLAVTGNEAIVDWIIVELRSSLTVVAHSKPALLRRDGSVIDTDGNTYLAFPNAPGNYRIALRHRNHLGVLTNSLAAFGLDPSATSIDLRSSAWSMYGQNARVFKGTMWCLWAGDATGNGTISYTGAGNDCDPILVAIGGTLPTATLTGQYRREDVNMDGTVKYTGANNDRDPILQNIGGTTPTNTRVQQLP